MTVWLPSMNRQKNFIYLLPFFGFFKQNHERHNHADSMSVRFLYWHYIKEVVMNLFFPKPARFQMRFLQKRSLLSLSLLSFSFLLISSILASVPAYANNAKIRNVALVQRDTTANTIQVQFDVSWQNAWSDPVNHDALWVFVKYSTAGSTGPWSHATMKTAGTNPSGVYRGTKDTVADTSPTVAASDFNTLSIVVPDDRKGAFLKPGHQASAAGTVNFDSVQLVWDYGADGITDTVARGSSTYIKVFAIEMVYIPEGGFIAGDGQTGTNGQFEFGDGTQNIAPSVNSEAGISFRSNSTSAWYYNTDNGANDASSGADFEVSEAFPKGFQAFYLMKDEISQGMYTDFLNTITTTQDGNHFPNQNGVSRHTITGSSGSRTVGKSDRACNFLTWPDLTAFADWAALRPISELEFEKAARGPLSAVSAEYAWGTTSKTNCTTISGTEDGTETCSTGSANANFGNNTFTGGDGSSGPLRAGIFAASTNTRAATGAGFYGNLDLTGNVSEMTVTLGNATGRGFAGSHGDGVLNTNGYATNEDWPGFVFGSGVTGSTGQGIRGGGWSDSTNARGEISDRYLAADEVSSRNSKRGGRCARTAP